MAIANSYFNSSPITDSDIFVGTKYTTNRTVNYTAQSIADYLNVNARISISGQLTFKFTILPNVAKTIAFENGGGDGRLFSSIDKLIVSILDAGGSNITVFLDYLIDSEILLAEQNQPNSFGHYKITSYTVTANPNFYELNLEYIGGNGNIYKDVYYDMTPWASSGGITTTPNLQQVTDEGNTTTNNIIVSKLTGTSAISIENNNNVLSLSADSIFGTLIELNDSNNNNYGSLSCGELLMTSGNSSENVQLNPYYLVIQSASAKPLIELSGSDGSVQIKTDLVDGAYAQQLPSKSGTFAMLDDIPSYTTPTLQEVLTSGSSSNIGLNISGSNTNIYLEEGIISTGNLDENGGFVRLFSDGHIGLQTTLKDGVIEIYSNSDNNYSILIPEKATDSVQTLAFLSDIPAAGVTSVGLTMPSAFIVTNSPITSSGDIAVTGAGAVSQYVRGDGTLANFPTSSGGGSSLSFYLNGSVSQGTIGGVAFREMDRTPILGAGTDFTINANGYIQSFITDAGVPNLLEIPAGNWNFETYFSASSNGGSPSFYVELYKWDGTTLSLIASSSANPEFITGGVNIDLYVSALAVPQTTLLATDRLAVRIYVTHSGRTIKLHTEDSHLCQVITTFSTGLTALNGLTAQVQNFAVGTTGTDFNISSVTATHTFNLPTASATNRGALSTTDWNTFNGKQNDLETFNRTQGIYYFEEFMGNLGTVIANSVNSITNVVGNGQGTLRSTFTITNRTNQQGVVEALTSANATGTAGYYYAGGVYKGSGAITIETYINFTTLSVLGERFFSLFGVYTGANFLNPANAIMIVYDEGGVVTPNVAGQPNFRCVTRIGGATITNTVTGVPVVAGQWYKLRINISNDGNTVTFFINNALVATHTTNIPLNATLLPLGCMLQKTSGVAARAMQTDYFMYKEIFTTPR